MLLLCTLQVLYNGCQISDLSSIWGLDEANT